MAPLLSPVSPSRPCAALLRQRDELAAAALALLSSHSITNRPGEYEAFIAATDRLRLALRNVTKEGQGMTKNEKAPRGGMTEP